MLSVLFFLVCYGTSICLFLGGVKDNTIPSNLDFPVFLLLAIADTILIIVFINIERIFFKMKINIPLIIILSCLFVVNLVVIVTTPLENTFEYVYMDLPGSKVISINNEYKVMYILCFLLLLLNIYISINYLIQRVDFKKHFVWICLLIVAVGLFLVIYSYITEVDTYKTYFENMPKIIKLYNFKSLTNNTNNYATILLGAEFCSFGLYAATKKHVFWILGLFFCFNAVFPLSHICLFLSFVLVLLFLFYLIIVSWKGNVFRNLNYLFLIFLPIGIFIIMCFSIPELRTYIEQIIITNDSSLDTRTPLWRLTIIITQGYHQYIGNGHGYFNTAFSTIIDGQFKMPHNLYIQTYGALGFLGLTLLAALICFAIYKIIRLYKNNRDASLISVVGLIIVLTYYLVEG